DLGEREDALAEELIAAYPVRDWTLAELLGLLDRRGRRKEPSEPPADNRAPEMLKAFIAECAVRGSGPELSRGWEAFDVPAPPDQPLFEVFSVGNGDYWVCTGGDRPTAYCTDHESGHYSRSEGIALGRLLAAWLFWDEVVAHGLEEHVHIEPHARALCPVSDTPFEGLS